MTGATSTGDLDTPVALVEHGRLDANLRRMADLAAAHGVSQRPHGKAHKTWEIARRQLGLGAIGLTAAKLGEAEAFVDSGVEDVFIAYPLIGDRKLERFVRLTERARVRFEVDSFEGASGASAFLSRRGVRAEVLLSVDGGAGRSGVASLPEAVDLALRIADLPNLDVVGIMSYGNAYGTRDPEEQRRIGVEEGRYAVAAARDLAAASVPVQVVSVGSTPTARHVVTVEGVTELRAGNYVFYDLKQVSLGAATLDDCALTVLATVVSHPRPERYVLDCGIKALAGEDYGWSTWGRPMERPDLVIGRATEEHGMVEIGPDDADPRWRIGDRVRIVPNHACGLVNMHDELTVVDGDRVVDRWPVVARGRVR